MNALFIQPSIQTFSGISFNFITGGNTVLIDDISHALANICRFGGHTRKFYSVAQHSVMVSYIVPAPLALWGLLHDAAEAYMGDMTRPLKELMPAFKDIEKRVEREIWELFGLQGDLPAEVKHADLVMLATERRDLMSDQLERWALLDGIDPLPVGITDPWLPERAQHEFVVRFGQIVREQCGRAE
jgi:hypothetical protein